MIAVDIDGVVANTSRFLRKEIEERSGLKIKDEKPEVFNFNVKITTKQAIQYIDDALNKYKDDIQPYSPVQTRIALKLIADEYGKVNFVTARTQATHASTIYWLKKHFGKIPHKVHSLGGSANKRKWMIDNGFNSIVEDRFKTVNNIDIEGGKTYLINRNWNIGRKAESHVIRVSNLLEAILDYV